jgi:hypothetical protein
MSDEELFVDVVSLIVGGALGLGTGHLWIWFQRWSRSGDDDRTGQRK